METFIQSLAFGDLNVRDFWLRLLAVAVRSAEPDGPGMAVGGSAKPWDGADLVHSNGSTVCFHALSIFPSFSLFESDFREEAWESLMQFD